MLYDLSIFLVHFSFISVPTELLLYHMWKSAPNLVVIQKSYFNILKVLVFPAVSIRIVLRISSSLTWAAS